MRPTLPVAAAFALVTSPALAETPSVVVDTAPLHSLVARVMAGAGTPELLLPPGVSPHDAALRPSDARHLSQADMVVWTGPALVPWLAESLAALAPEAETLAMLDSDGWERLPLREDPAFETAHGRGDAAHDDDHDAGEHEETEGHGEASEYADHAEVPQDDHGDDHPPDDEMTQTDEHAGGDTDPHAWLDPQVAAAWMTRLAEALAEINPENATLYRDNAAAAIAADADLSADISERLASLSGLPYLVPHDAYQYFERRFGLPATGAVSLSDASAPGPARLAALREMIEAGSITCILTDPETPPDLVALLRENTQAKTAMADPDGLRLEPGPDLYPALIEDLAAAFESCLG
ncbi:zinc transport system substrate-binding protein [Limimaricola soesokkakensis]|uniref:High-affinity zinc uptake system protein ZnuA n=1 Tax=Limimaricola soesokkakensis TaxID=1343159 RepID=A0A1X6Y7M8_9RHOB|nr:zinc ABC transporter substrate-binding protein [Limimaricola soesokkakensis]PSK87284.1 zinc transport system substrate-binding protein [Limimaricola soesokkakensis]SLN12674.1 High-affinity zinc uptake system protein ZnuA precursor [Limimaricola soesokkakensis]